VDIEIDIHGGLTFSEQKGDGFTWFGFDCAHMNDFSPGMYLEFLKQWSPWGGTSLDPHEYRTWEWVEKEVMDLALQLLHLADYKDKHVP
jgi:hypothetical protein